MTRYERSEVTHVLDSAAYLELFLPKQGEENFQLTPLNVVVSAGEQQFIEESDASFRLRFRRIQVSLQMSNCSLAQRGRFTQTLSDDEVALFREKLRNHKSLREDELSGVADMALAHKLLKIGLSGRFLRSRSDTTETKDNITQRLKVNVVGKAGGPNWEIGHEVLGDPRHYDALLKGDYLNEAVGDDTEDVRPLCYIQPEGDTHEYSIDVIASVNKRDLVYFPLGQNRDLSDWRERNKIAIEGTLARKMLDNFCNNRQLKSRPGEIILAHVRLTAMQESSQ